MRVERDARMTIIWVYFTNQLALRVVPRVCEIVRFVRG